MFTRKIINFYELNHDFNNLGCTANKRRVVSGDEFVGLRSYAKWVGKFLINERRKGF